MNPVRLLLVEDDAVSRGFLTLALQSMPATVVDVATNATQALSHSHDAPHALWLLDANLPDASGEELLGALRELRPDIPALCLTAEVLPERFDRLHAAGFVEVLQKPLTIAALHAAVRRALSGTGPVGRADAPVWDDAMALRALGGNAAAVQAMRGLFVAELPKQAEAIAHAIAADDIDGARAELHKLKASCGFVGSPRLLDAIHALFAAPDDPQCFKRFREQVVAAQSRS
ncbi:MAG TPA: response regulator [Xanthomonadaceae bacterium]|jgi:DNA-binding response OmpR family regulator|nr:response regulator [Xanthomonadaceae bacterium]